MSIRFLSRASREVAEAVEFYDGQRPGLGLEFLQELDLALGFIEQFPKASPKIRGSVRRALFRRFPYGIMYREQGDDIIVAAVMDLRKDPSSGPEGDQ